MIYIDEKSTCIPTPHWPWDYVWHLIADTEEELHTFAKKIGLRREWFQTSSMPHYDLTYSKAHKAILKGAMELTREEFINKLRKYRGIAIK